MCDLGINIDNFNPRILYVFKENFNNKSNVTYHCHDFVSLVYVLSGECTYKINNELYRVKKGDLMIFNPEVYHGKMFEAKEEILEFQTGFNNLFIENIKTSDFLPASASPFIALSKYDIEFYKYCTEILLVHERHEVGFELILKTEIMKLIVLILKAINIDEAEEVKDYVNIESYDKMSIVSSIITYIEDNYMHTISLEKISKNMYLSPVYISKIFKESTGDSPINFLIKKRLSKAVELISNGNISIKSISNAVGYNDAYYFSKLFKKYYGCPPSKYKYNQKNIL